MHDLKHDNVSVGVERALRDRGFVGQGLGDIREKFTREQASSLRLGGRLGVLETLWGLPRTLKDITGKSGVMSLASIV